MPPDAVLDEFLAGLGLSTVREAELLRGGANNRVYRVPPAGKSGPGGQSAVLKIYFRRDREAWDRFRAESAFYRHALPRAGEFLCAPLGWSEPLRVGCFEWVDGGSFVGVEVGEAEIVLAAEFVRLLQAGREATALSPGAEAMFTGPDHASLISARLERLKGLDVTDDLSAEVRRFAVEELDPLWHDLAEGVRSMEPLAADQRCVSPSDFGFHNALHRGGRVWFIDFEYAGLDDPAKLICDFFWQPEVPVSWRLRGRFLSEIGGALGEPDVVAARAGRLFPAFGIKWCCIVLNDFVKADRARREFALGDAAEAEKRREQQFTKAKALAAKIPAARGAMIVV